ncbi:MAG: S8 family peptidase [Promethearchaeia archaeon]
MNSDKIHPLLKRRLTYKLESIFNKFLKVKSSESEKGYKVIISFRSIDDRDKFIDNRKSLLDKFEKINIIPAISTNISEDIINDLSSDELIDKIEENQQLYLSILEVKKILRFNEYQRSLIQFYGKNVKVGIIDDGINTYFDSIYDIIEKEYKINSNINNLNSNCKETDNITHGTLMASIIANQYVDYESLPVGFASGVKIISINISNENNEFYFSDILKSFDLIISKNVNIDILLIPFSTLYPSDGSDILCKACEIMDKRDIIIVCPAGNFGAENDTIGSPGACEKVITFGATTKKGTIAYFSGRGKTSDNSIKPEFCLPGSKIEIPLNADVTVQMSGTSISAAIGVGIIALLKEYNRSFELNDIINILKNACEDLGYDKISQGNGIINVRQLFKNLGVFEEGIVPYNYLIKRSAVISIKFTIIMFLILFLWIFFNFSQYFKISSS